MDLLKFIELTTAEKYPSVISRESFINPDIITHYLNNNELHLKKKHKSYSIIKPILKKNIIPTKITKKREDVRNFFNYFLFETK